MKNVTIGNWYLVGGKPTKITSTNVVWALEEGCLPIPLTDKILFKYGFRREGGVAYWHDDHIDACILYWNKDKMELIINDNEITPRIRIDVLYVHQLQDAMRLVEINKEFEL